MFTSGGTSVAAARARVSHCRPSAKRLMSDTRDFKGAGQPDRLRRFVRQRPGQRRPEVVEVRPQPLDPTIPLDPAGLAETARRRPENVGMDTVDGAALAARSTAAPARTPGLVSSIRKRASPLGAPARARPGSCRSARRASRGRDDGGLRTRGRRTLSDASLSTPDS